METSPDYTARFIMHAELYMLLTGKNARELSLNDMQRIGEYLNTQSQWKYKAANTGGDLSRTEKITGGG